MFLRHKLKPFPIFLPLPLLILIPATNIEFTRIVPDNGPLDIRSLENNAVLVFLHIDVVIRLDPYAEHIADIFSEG